MSSAVEENTALDVSIDPSSCNTTKNIKDMESSETSCNIVERITSRSALFKSCLSIITIDVIRKVSAEFMGTFILVYCVYGILSSMSFTGLGTGGGLTEYAATAALTVIIIVTTLGPISGAHVNPSVTVAFASVGRFPWSKVPLYIAAQIGGSVLATWVGWLVYGVKMELMMTVPAHGSSAAFWVEFFASFIILFLIASIANDPEPNVLLSALLAGVGIGLGVLITGPVSGGSMNPARSFGPAILLGEFRSLWIYVVAPTLGAICGVFAFRILRLQGWSCQ